MQNQESANFSAINDPLLLMLLRMQKNALNTSVSFIVNNLVLNSLKSCFALQNS